jgi:hypothetical protein
VCALGLGLGTGARAYADAAWRYAPALAPSPPPGVPAAPYPVPLGEVGELSFWAPNRGLLITGGTAPAGAVAAGLYAYDGVQWHQLSTVCGGAQGRIAWAAPDEFWTIADQRSGQINSRQEGDLSALSLCHFVNGEVVASYAMPLGEPGSYLQMDAAGCLSPSDCWFAGEDGQQPNLGSFHLHWDGSSVSAVYDPEDHAVTGMAAFQDKLYEGLAIGPEDVPLPGESLSHPAVIRTVAPSGQPTLCEGTPSLFCDVFLFAEQPLPVYPASATPSSLSGFDLATDGSPLGTGASQLWAGANPAAGSGSAHGSVTILRETHGSWSQVLPGPEGSPPQLPGNAYLSGSQTDQRTSREAPVGGAIAPEPGTADAWLSLGGLGGLATVALLEAPQQAGETEGRILETDQLPGSADPVGGRGTAGPIDCPALNDCWMATSEGWMFHLTDGTQLEQDADPNFNKTITYRPPDASVPVIYPDEPPVDDSLANQQPAATSGSDAATEPGPVVKPTAKKAKPLVEHIKSAFAHGRVLTVSFTLTARAHVQLIGRRKSKVVAKTRNEALRVGRHRLSLTLNRKNWPTKLQFKATPLSQSPSADVESGSSGGSSNSISTG